MQNHKIAIYTYADLPQYIAMANRQAKSVKWGTKADHFIFNECTPSHNELHCGFKLYKLYELLEKNYDLIAWADSSVAFNRFPKTIFTKTLKDGHYFIQYDKSVITSDWLSDNALKIMGKQRSKYKQLPSFAGGLFCLDFQQPFAWDFIRQWWLWKEAMQCPTNKNDKDNRIRNNDNGEASVDPSVKGHRMQAVMTVAAQECGVIKGHKWGTDIHYGYNKDSLGYVEGRLDAGL